MATIGSLVVDLTLNTTKFLGSAGQSQKEIDRMERRMRRSFRRLDSQVAATTKRMERYALVAGAAAVAFSVKAAADFEKKLTEVSTLLDDTSSIDLMAAAVRNLSVQYGQMPLGQIEAVYSIISAGAADTSTALNILEVSNRLAIGGLTDVSTAADVVTSVLNAYAGRVSNATDVSDAMFVAMRAGKTTITELSQSLGLVVAIAAQAGVSFDELLAATAALTKGGLSTANSVTGLRGIIAAIIKPSSEAVEKAKELGIEFSAAALQAKGLSGFLADVADKTNNDTAALAKLFGRVEALGAVMALTGTQAADFSAIVDDMGRKAGATGDAVGKMQETSSQAMARLQASGAVLAEQVGKQLLPAFADLAEFLIGPMTNSISVVENAFFAMRQFAFAVLESVSRKLQTLVKIASFTPVGFLSRKVSDDIQAGFDEATSTLQDFADAMAEGGLATATARIEAEKHAVALQEEIKLAKERALNVTVGAVAPAGVPAAGAPVEDKAAAKAAERAALEQEMLRQNLQTQAVIMLEAQLSERERADLEFTERMQRLTDFRDQEVVTAMEFNALKEQLELEHQASIGNISAKGELARRKFTQLSMRAQVKTVVGSLLQMTQGVAQHNKTMFKINKAAGTANALINTFLGVTKALSSYPPPLSFVMAAAQLGAGMAQVSAIRSQSFGGGGVAPSIAGTTPAPAVSPVTPVSPTGQQGLQPAPAAPAVTEIVVNLDSRPIFEAVHEGSIDGRLEISAAAVR